MGALEIVGLCENVLLSFGPLQGRKNNGFRRQGRVYHLRRGVRRQRRRRLLLGRHLESPRLTISNASVLGYGGTTELGQKRVSFAEFGPILEEAKKNVADIGVKEDYIEGLKVFDKNGSGLVSCTEVKQVLCSLAEKLESKQADQLMELLEVKEDEDGLIKYMELIDKLLAFKA